MRRLLILFFLLSAIGSCRQYIPDIGKLVNPEMSVISTESRDGYECRYVEFSVGENKDACERVRAYLLVPYDSTSSKKFPAVVMLHDHGARFDIGKEKLVRPMASILTEGNDDHILKSSEQWIDKYFDGVYLADSLASLGYVVLVADALYWGERSSADAHRWSELSYNKHTLDLKVIKDTLKALKNRVYEGQRAFYDSLQSDGVIWAEKILRDDVSSVELLKSLPYVDKNNIGAFGFSMGAHRCWMLSAFCKDVKCGVALSWMTTLDRDAELSASDYSMAIMQMREEMDFGDIGKYLAPKPMFFISGDEDHLFPKDKTQQAYDILKEYYYEDPEELITTFFNGGHHCGKDVQSQIFQYLDYNLNLN